MIKSSETYLQENLHNFYFKFCFTLSENYIFNNLQPYGQDAFNILLAKRACPVLWISIIPNEFNNIL